MMELYWTWTKMRLSYLANKGIRYGVVLTNQIKSFLLVCGAVNTTINDQRVVWVLGKGH